MDGASKFVRGDAIAGIVITLVNIIGGVAIGVFDNGLSTGEALKTFGLLAIGDGLVSQIPAFIVAIAAGLIVARAGGGKTISDAIPTQLVSQPASLLLIAVFLTMLAFTGLPALPLLSAAGVLGVVGFLSQRSANHAVRKKRAIAEQESASERTDQPVEDLLGVDTMEIEIGYALVQLVDVARGGDLLERIAMIRRQLAVDMGMVLPPVRIRDNVQLPSEQYKIKIRGAVVGEGTVHPGMLMAMDSGLATSELAGVQEIEPAFGLEVIWIETAQRSQAENANYTVVDAESVLATHLTEIARVHADELLTREEVSKLLEQLKERAPKLVEEAVPAHVKPGDLQKVLQALLRERVPIRDLETIVETLSDWAPHTNDPEILVEYVRNALRRTICARYTEPSETGATQLHCVTMDPAIEDRINAYVDRSTSGTTLSLPPQLGGAIGRATAEAVHPLLEAGHRAIVVTSPSVRAQVRQIVLSHVPDVVVLGYNEILPGIVVESMGLVQVEEEAPETAEGARMVESV
jgi:flagellar biosynthesis protein FlhA